MKPIVVLTRTDHIESLHEGFICVTDSNKKTVFSIGDINSKVYLRSSAKPIQSVAFVHSGAMDRFDISLEELAVISSSHSGEDFHRKSVSSILGKIGLGEDDLECGVANPYNKDMINDLIKKGHRPSKLYNCCSGKHAAMLAVCRHYGYPTKGYTELEHPVQKLILKIIAELLECEAEDIQTGVDGCGVPSLLITLHQASYLYSLLAQGSKGSSRYKDCFGLIQKAMISYPCMVNGDKEFCTDLITHSNGSAIGKVGAEGIYCVAVPEKQLGICIKTGDGSERAVYPVTIHLLKELGVLDDDAIKKLIQWAYPPVKDHKGNVVGYTIPVFNINNKDNKSVQIGQKLVFKGE